MKSPHHGCTVAIGLRIPSWLAEAADTRAKQEQLSQGLPKSPGRGWGIRALAAEGLAVREASDG